MIAVISPRIHNLGDFVHCLPVLSGLYKFTNHKMWFIICNRLKRFKGIKELLLAQEMFEKVTFVDEEPVNWERCILIDDTGSDIGYGSRPIVQQRYYNFIKDNYRINFDFDDDFELQVPKLDIDYHEKQLIVGDRWSPKDAPDVDDRRNFNVIESSGIVKDYDTLYLDYKNDLVYNCSLIKYNPNPFVTTITGIGIVADLMKKDTYVLWDEDMRTWQGDSVDHVFRLHHFENRNTKLVYIKDFIYENQTV